MAKRPRVTITGGSLMKAALAATEPQIKAAMRKAIDDVARSPRRGSGPSVEQLVAVIRQYQHANGPDRLAEADAAAVALIGEAPLETVTAPKRRRAKVERS